MTDEVERTYFEQDKAYMHHIGELPSYSGMNYAIAEQDRIFEYEQDEVDDSVEGVVLEEADENDTENAVTTDFNEVSPKIFDLINRLGIKNILTDQSQLITDTTVAQFDSDNNNILLRNDYQSYVNKMGMSLNDILLHEYIHVITSYVMDNADEMSTDVQTAVKTIKAIYKTLLEKEKSNYMTFNGSIMPYSNDYYGLTSIYEMIAELANPKFRKILDKHKLSDRLITSLHTLVNNFDATIYNKWNKARTAQKWFRGNTDRVSINEFVGKQLMGQIDQQLTDKPDGEIAELTINIPEHLASQIYDQLGGQSAKNKPFTLAFDNGVIMMARLTGLKPSDKKFKGLYKELDSYNMTIETHPTLIALQEYEKAGKQYKPLSLNTQQQLVFVNHSGGAIGSDTMWGEIGEEYGVVSNHYYHGAKTPNGNIEITEEQFERGKQHVYKANETLHRRPDKYMNLLARNWIQVENSDAVFAIGQLKNNVVDGGTGWAVQMAIDVNKPVYVFDQERNKWYTNIDKNWVEIGTPTLTPNFAGIGTRNINQNGIKAIRDVYENTFRENGIEQDNGRFSEVITMVRDIIREDMPNSTKSTVKELTGIDLLALYDQGNKRISEVLDTLEDLTADERQTYLNEFAQQMTRDNVNTQDKLEEALRKFICNL